MDMLTNTVAPKTWSDAGGTGDISQLHIGKDRDVLVISQTQEVQEQVEATLNMLRKVGGLKTAAEARDGDSLDDEPPVPALLALRNPTARQRAATAARVWAAMAAWVWVAWAVAWAWEAWEAWAWVAWAWAWEAWAWEAWAWEAWEAWA